MERKDGYLIKDDSFKYLYSQKKNSYFTNNSVFWYLDENTQIEYVLKSEQELNCYKEIFYPYLLKAIGLPTVENDMMRIDDQLYVVSKSYNPNHHPHINITDIYKEYFHGDSDWTYYNLHTLRKAVVGYLKENNKKYETQIRDNLTFQFIIQILLGNKDLNTSNIEIYGSEISKVAPFYDFSQYGLINLKRRDNRYKLKMLKPKDEAPISAKETCLQFLLYSKKKELETFKEYLEKLKSIKLENQFASMEEQIKYPIPNDIAFRLKKELKDNLKNIERIMKKYL